MATYSDDFNRTNADTLGGNWTVWSDNDVRIRSNQANSDWYSSVFYSASASADDQFSQITLKTNSAGAEVFLFVRASGNSETGNAYRLLLRNIAGTWSAFIGAMPNGGYTALTWVTASATSFSPTLAVDDVVRLEVEGTTLRFKKNGSTLDTVTNGTVSSGSPGFGMYGGTVEVNLDDWSGGDLSGAASIVPQAMANYRMRAA
jgi:hypothetical protein